MKKHISLIMAGALACGTLLSACGASSNSGSESSSTSGASSTGEKTVMTLSCLNGGNNQKFADLMLKQIEEFNASNSYNVEIRQEAYSNDQYKTKIATLMASNSQPDLFMTFESGWLEPFVEGGKVYPIGDKFTQDTEWQGRFDDKSVFEPLTFDGKIYAMTGIQQITVLAYNKALFDAAGATVPTTYSEFLETCEKLKNSGTVPLVIPCKEAWYGGQFLQQLSNGIGGTALFNGIRDGSRTWDDAAFVEAGTALQELVNKEYLPSGFLGMSGDEGYEMFNSGKAAMINMLTSALTQINKTDSAVYKDIEFFRLPTDIAENAGVNVGSIGQSYAVSSKAENIDAAVEFVKSLSTPEFQLSLAYDCGQVIVTNAQVDNSKIDPLSAKLSPLFAEVTTYTPWFDRVFGSGEGGEFNNAAVAIMGGDDSAVAMGRQQQFAVDNSNR